MAHTRSSHRNALRIALVSIMTAVVVVFTLIVRVPTPIKGYISLCDVVICFTAYAFGPVAALLAGGLGTGIADLIGGYAQWAPLSFAIHGLQGLLIALIVRSRTADGNWSDPSMVRMIFGGLIGVLVMTGGYYLAGGVLYGFEPALAEIPLNLLQSSVGMVLGIIVTKAVRAAYPPVRSLYW